MILKRFYDEPLAHASYLIGCPGAGEAIVVDPNRDLSQYIEAAAAEGMRIAGVTETHIHADYASGSLELAERTGATLYLSDEGDADWKYAFADRPFVRLVKNGDEIRVGMVRLEVLHTPGHTPEHLSFLVTDEATDDQPFCALTGDFIFVGDVGRPDLLERAAGIVGAMDQGARSLFRSIQKFKQLPESLLLWPGHGTGSPCGKSLGGVPASTLAYELRSNWALKITDEDRFVEDVLAGQPAPPTYYKEMKRLNKAGAAPVGSLGAPPRLGGLQMLDLLERGETIVDARSIPEAQAGSPVSTLNIPLGKSFSSWSGWLLPYDRPIYILASSEDDSAKVKRSLALIGLDDVPAWFGPDALSAYVERFGSLVATPQMSVDQFLPSADEFTVLDVRNPSETALGAIPNALNIPLGHLESRIDEVPQDKPLVIHCAGGTRSSMAISLLRRHGIEDTVNLVGGYSAYQKFLRAAKDHSEFLAPLGGEG
jgi:hydroxyacylglutathione hydrolase